MPSLSDNELTEANKLSRQIIQHESWMKKWPLWAFLWVFFTVETATNLERAWRAGSGELLLSMVFFALWLVFIPVILTSRMKYLKRHIHEYNRLLEELRRKAGGKLPPLPDTPEDYSLLGQRIERFKSRAILWRVDRFLRGDTISR